jgi:hypothetical protein
MEGLSFVVMNLLHCFDFLILYFTLLLRQDEVQHDSHDASREDWNPSVST